MDINQDKLSVLFASNCYPHDQKPDYGIFVKEQIEGIAKKLSKHKVVYPNFDEKSSILKYYRYYQSVKRNYNDYDIIHCFHGLSLIICLLATQKKKIICSYLNSIENEIETNSNFIKWLTKNFFKLLNNYNKRVFVIYKSLKINSNDYGPRSIYLPNGVDLELFHPISRDDACKKLSLDHTKTYILHVSSKEKNRKQKRYDIFTEVMFYLKKNYPADNFEELCMSGISREMCKYYFNASKLHLLTSDFEGSPNSVKESIHCNTPVISTDVGDVKQNISGLEGCYITSQNIKEIAKKIIEVTKIESVDYKDILIKKRLDSHSKSEDLYNFYIFVKKDKIFS